VGKHLIGGQFQSDKYPATPPGKVPLSVKDKTAQDLLWQYAQRRREVDAEFSKDLELALLTAGFRPSQARSSEALKGCVAALLGLSFIDTFDVWDIVLQEMFGASMAHMTHTEQLRLLRDIHRVTVEHAPASDDLVRAAREVVALKAARHRGEVWDRVKNAIGALEDLIGPEPAVTDAQNQRSSE